MKVLALYRSVLELSRVYWSEERFPEYRPLGPGDLEWRNTNIPAAGLYGFVQLG